METLSERIFRFLAEEARNRTRYIHSIGRQTAKLLEILKRQGLYQGGAARISLIKQLSDFHDIGKICVPPEILDKPGRLTEEENSMMRMHPVFGGRLVEELGRDCASDRETLRLAADICLLHHERLDGSGYPFGLKGDQIPLEIQAVSLADAFDALCSERSYKKALPPREAAELICRGECGAFSEELRAALRDMAGGG